MTLCSTSELVAISWLRGVTGLTPRMVAATVPKDNTSWSASGAATVVWVRHRSNGGYPVLMLDQPMPHAGGTQMTITELVADPATKDGLPIDLGDPFKGARQER